ncbi:unknown [Firmicutes bacterium CAG:822]|nr:unknown [Firmicutes bacterium CAG:822]
MHRSKKKRNIVIFSLVGILLCMVVGYAAFQTRLEIKGTSKVTSNWNILITNVTDGTPTGSAENAVKPSWKNTSASMEANLYDKGDAMEYDVTIENKGTIDAKLNDILTNLQNSNSDAVIITFSGYTKGEVLQAGGSKLIHVKIEYNPEYEGGETSSEVEIDFEYTQDNKSEDIPDTYLLTYDYRTNGGERVDSEGEYLTSGSNVDLSNVAYKQGWRFVGWNTDKDAEVGMTSYQMKEQATTLYAIYSKDLTVTYEKGENVESISKNEDACTIYNNETSCEVTLPTITPSTGYAVDGWYNGNDKAGDPEDKYSLTNNITLTSKVSQNTYTVTYDYETNGGTSTTKENDEVNYGEEIDLTPTATKSGWTFVGWNTNKDATTGLSSLTMGDSNVTLYAIYRKEARTITITFNKNGSTSQTPSGGSANTANTLTQSCTIAAVYNNATQANSCNITSPTINPSSNTPTVVGYNTSASCNITTPSITRSGFTITGWGTSASATSAAVKVNTSVAISSNITYYAVTSKVVTVTYSKGSNVSSIGSTSGTCTIRNSATNCQVTLPSITPNAGYSSVGWSTTSGATTGTAAGSKLTLSNNATYYANAIDNIAPTAPSITNSSKGAWSGGNVTVTVTSTDEGSGIDHYEWYENGAWTTRALSTSNGVGTITFTADRNTNIQFRAIDKAGNISAIATTPVKIDTANPTLSISTTNTTNSITVVANASATSGISKYEFSKDGGKTWQTGTGSSYTFTGLTAGTSYNIQVRVTSNSGKTSTSSKNVTTSSISKPTFSEEGTTSKTVTITYPSGCGSSLTCTYQKDNGTAVNVTSSTVKVSFTDSGNLKATVSDGTNTVSSSYTVKVGRTVTYNYSTNGGTSATKTTATVEEGSAIDLTPTATKSGWTFVGWNTNKDATTKLSSLTMGDSNVTLYAIYRKEAKTITITFNKNGATSQTPNGGSANSNTSLTQSCTIAAVYNNATQATSCNITSPTINASSNTPTVIGYNTSSSATSSSWNQKTSKAVSSNATYYAITKKDAVTLTAKYNANGASLSSTSNQTCTLAASYNGKAQATSCTVTAPTITRSGYTIIGYNTSASSTTNNSSYNTSSKALTLTASNNNSTWYAVTSKKITITFDKNGASAIGSTSQSCTMYNTSASCNVTSPSITGSTNTPTVIGWSTAASTHSNQWSVNTAKAVSANDTYYAQTSKAAKTVTITFNKNGATSQTPNGGSANTGTSLTQSCTIAATYNGTAQATTCNITSPTINPSTNTPTVVGYNTSSSATSSSWNHKTSKAVSSNATYYAITKKDAKTITVTFNKNGASSIGATSRSCTIAATYNGTAQGTTCSITSPTITASSGFSVLGWNTSSGSTSSAWTQNTAKSFSSNATYYAVTRSSSQLTATFNKNGATSIGSASQSCYRYNGGSSCNITTPSITRSGFTITGWGTSASATSAAVKVNTSVAISSNITYYAVTSKVVTVTYSKGSNVSSIGSTSGTCTIRNSATNCQVTLPSITASSTYVADGWYSGSTRVGSAGAKYTVSNNTTLTAQAKADNISLSISTTNTTNSITVVANATADSGIAKYEFSKDGGKTWVNGGTSKTYTFNGLNQGTSYNIQVRVTASSGKTTSTSKSVTTSSLTKPTFSETDLPPKTVTITYPSGCGSTLTCTYQKDDGYIVSSVTSIVELSFADSGDLVATISDGTNTISSSYTVIINNGFYDDGDCRYYWENGARQTEWFFLGDVSNPIYYYANNEGCLQKGWIKNDWAVSDYACPSQYYYLNDDYTMAMGWKLINNKWYYFAKLDSKENKWQNRAFPRGCMMTGWVYSEDYSCASHGWYFNSDGSMATNTYIGNYWVDSSGCWIQ